MASGFQYPYAQNVPPVQKFCTNKYVPNTPEEEVPEKTRIFTDSFTWRSNMTQKLADQEKPMDVCVAEDPELPFTQYCIFSSKYENPVYELLEKLNSYDTGIAAICLVSEKSNICMLWDVRGEALTPYVETIYNMERMIRTVPGIFMRKRLNISAIVKVYATDESRAPVSGFEDPNYTVFMDLVYKHCFATSAYGAYRVQFTKHINAANLEYDAKIAHKMMSSSLNVQDIQSNVFKYRVRLVETCAHVESLYLDILKYLGYQTSTYTYIAMPAAKDIIFFRNDGLSAHFPEGPARALAAALHLLPYCPLMKDEMDTAQGMTFECNSNKCSALCMADVQSPLGEDLWKLFLINHSISISNQDFATNSLTWFHYAIAQAQGLIKEDKSIPILLYYAPFREMGGGDKRTGIMPPSHQMLSRQKLAMDPKVRCIKLCAYDMCQKLTYIYSEEGGWGVSTIKKHLITKEAAIDIYNPQLRHVYEDMPLNKRIDKFLSEYPLLKTLIVDIRHHIRVEVAHCMYCPKPQMCALHELFEVCLKSKRREYGDVAIVMLADALPFELFHIDVKAIAKTMFGGTKQASGDGALTRLMMDYMGDMKTCSQERLVAPLITELFDIHRLNGRTSGGDSNGQANAAIDEYIFINETFNAE